MRSFKARNICRKRSSNATANSPAVLDRIIGVEHEYAFRYANGGSRNSHALFQSIVDSMLEQMPGVQSDRNPNRYFLANGGSISWEPNASSIAGAAGFVEVATPQCRRPKEVVAYLSAFDQLVSNAIADSAQAPRDQVPVSAIRNNADAEDHKYGQQENYEVRIATGFWLVLWRAGLVLLLPLLLLHRLLVRLILRFTIGGKSSKLDSEYTQQTNAAAQESALHSISLRRLKVATFALQAIHAPIERLFLWLCRAVVLRPHRRCLGNFLASRVVVDGSGHVDANGVFWIGARAKQMTSFIGFGGSGNARPMIDLSHWFRDLCLDDSKWFKTLGKLWASRQRIQICCGDASTNELVRWIQIGSTSLVLDLIESGWRSQEQCLPKPAKLLKQFAKDERAEFKVKDRAGKYWSAIAMQEAYIQRIRHYFSNQKRVPAEAWELLNSWKMILMRLQTRQCNQVDSQWLVGRCDWHTKQQLLARLPANASISARRKIDIRYHEVGVDGYHQRILSQQKISPLVDKNFLDRAMRTPPADTAATRRGYMIREFADSDFELAVDWETTELKQ